MLAAAEASERRLLILDDIGFDFIAKCLPDAFDVDSFFPLAMSFTSLQIILLYDMEKIKENVEKFLLFYGKRQCFFIG